MNRLSDRRRAQILSCLVEGMSIRATSRIAGAAKNTIQKLSRDVGIACGLFQHERLRNLPCTHIQADEAWAFCGMKERNVPRDKQGVFGYGNVWVWTALCMDTKIVPSWVLGNRDQEAAMALLCDLQKRLAHRITLNTDGLRAYHTGVVVAFGGDVDYARVVKNFSTPNRRWSGVDNRYSPPIVTNVKRERVCGNPKVAEASTSYVERFNLGLRMGMRRMTRLTNGHSRKVENFGYALNLHYTHYNWCRKHESLNGATPAMANGLTSRVWTTKDLIGLLPAWNRDKEPKKQAISN